MTRKSQMAGAQAPSNISFNPVFYVRENKHTDGSVQFDVYQRGSEQRLASAADELRANALCTMLSDILTAWEASNSGNTVDA